jgi:putative nucleotidyltransferase with HDIG domain
MRLDSYDTQPAAELLDAAKRRRLASGQRVALTEAAGAGAFLGAATLIACLAHSQRSLSVLALAVTAGIYLLSARLEFPVAAGWTRPTQLAFVPMLFLLPVTLVPFVVMGCLVLDLAFDVRRRSIGITRVLTRVGDSAYSLGPVLVLILMHAQLFRWTHWPAYALAFAAQIACDYAAYAGRSWLAEGMVPSAQVQVVWAYTTDACMSCGGLLIVAPALRRPAEVLLSVPLLALVGLFAQERSGRLESSVALSSAYRGTARLLGDVIEDDDEYTGIHSREVVELSIAVSDRLGLGARQRRQVEFGALLHDVGKIRVPKAIVHKPGKLDEAEWAIMRQHTVYGEEMLQQVGGTLASVGTIVRHSHERFDGGGYPDGLVGEAIPIESRIVCACDAFNAITTDRPYRPGRSVSEAIAELRRCQGTQFDPAVVAVLAQALGETQPAEPVAPQLVAA